MQAKSINTNSNFTNCNVQKRIFLNMTISFNYNSGNRNFILGKQNFCQNYKLFCTTRFCFSVIAIMHVKAKSAVV